MSKKYKKRVSVTFAGDDDVHHHIESLNIKKRNFPLKKKEVNDSSEDEASDVSPKDEEEEEEIFRPIAADGEESVGVTGSQVFGFKANKRSHTMAAKVSESIAASPQQKKSQEQSQKNKTSKNIVKTPTRQSRRVQSLKSEKTSTKSTPHRLRKRNEIVYNESESDGSGSESESDTSAPPSPDISKPADALKVVKKKAKAANDVVTTESVDAYFEAQEASVLTSDRTLAKLSMPRMDQHTLHGVLQGSEDGLLAERKQLTKDLKSHFRHWMYLLCSGFNLLLYGVGSKRNLLEDFRLTLLKDLTHVVVNGYFPSLTIKSVLNHITEEILEHSGGFQSALDQSAFIKRKLIEEDLNVFVVIHNIDGSTLRNERSQSVLAHLAQSPNVHLMASVDHINSPLLWDQGKMAQLKFLWINATTYAPYDEETCYENSLLVQQSGGLALSSLKHVSQSLPPNSRRIYLLLVKYHLEHSDDQGYQGLSFPLLYQKCREAFFVNTDQTLRSHLTEFRDHKLIRIRKMDGVEMLSVPLDSQTLKDFVEQQDEEI